MIRIVLLAVVFWASVACAQTVEEAVPPPAAETPTPLEVGAESPRLAVFDIYGERFDSAEQLGKRFIIYNFFTTYCQPCIREFAGFRELARRFGDRLVVVLINTGQDERGVLKLFQRDHHMDAAVMVRDRFGLIRKEFGIGDLVPVTFLVDPEGKIVCVQLGAFPDGNPLDVLKALMETGDE